jgi:hypothetical protein
MPLFVTNRITMSPIIGRCFVFFLQLNLGDAKNVMGMGIIMLFGYYGLGVGHLAMGDEEEEVDIWGWRGEGGGSVESRDSGTRGLTLSI